MQKWDFWGVFISGLCVVHCVALPVVLLLFPSIALKYLPSEDWTHVILLAFILGVAGMAFVTGYRVHGQWRPVAWLLIGLVVIVYATFFAHRQLGHLSEPLIAVAGSLCLIRAHFLNHHCKRCHNHHKHHHDPAPVDDDPSAHHGPRLLKYEKRANNQNIGQNVL
jgi:hypothetical protein